MSDCLAGKLLIAMPGIGDPRFERTVILVCAHNDALAMGVVVNKPREEVRLGEVLDALGLDAEGDAVDRIVLNGGPVTPDRGFVLHSEDFEGEGTQEVAPGLRLTTSRDVLEAIGRARPPRDYVLALGYAGWGAGQLESELTHNVWLVADARSDIVFAVKPERAWERAIASLGLKPGMLMSEGGSA